MKIFFADCVQKHNAEIVFKVFKPHFPSLLLISSWTQKPMKKLYKMHLKTYHERLALGLPRDVESKFGTPTSTKKINNPPRTLIEGHV